METPGTFILATGREDPGHFQLRARDVGMGGQLLGQRQCGFEVFEGSLGLALGRRQDSQEVADGAKVQTVHRLAKVEMSEGLKTFYYLGYTEWLIVEQRELDPPVTGGGRRIERHLRINAPGLLEALVLVAGATVCCFWAYRRLVHRLTLSAY